MSDINDLSYESHYSTDDGNAEWCSGRIHPLPQHVKQDSALGGELTHQVDEGNWRAKEETTEVVTARGGVVVTTSVVTWIHTAINDESRYYETL
jgi:hypothetical protein